MALAALLFGIFVLVAAGIGGYLLWTDRHRGKGKNDE